MYSVVIDHPGNRVDIWMNNKKIKTIHTLTHSEQIFMRNFITNLEDLGWNVLVEVYKE